ncbi:MAG TPA: 50S ribosomal protein L19 [Armatimonadota bacterium]|nr:50S ribosomal protein L19 [Armatimonadota bacterium]
MADLMKQIQEEYCKQDIPEFRPGDTVRVGVRISEGTGKDQRSRVQPYEGVVIGRSGGGLDETFTVRRVTHGVGVERTFPVHSPVVSEIVVVRRGDPRRAKLYYLRSRVGRGARVRELAAPRPPKAGIEPQAAPEQPIQAQQTEQ